MQNHNMRISSSKIFESSRFLRDIQWNHNDRETGSGVQVGEGAEGVVALCALMGLLGSQNMC